MKKTHLILTVFAGMLVLSIAALSCSDAPATTETSVAKPEPAMQVVASALIKEYDANEVAADDKYKGKTVTISGTIDDIGKDIADDPYITFGSGEELGITSVQCMFKDKAEVARLSKGQQVIVTGKVDGKLLNVLLRDCELKQ